MAAARLGPTSRGSSHVAPLSGTRPIRPKASRIDAPSAITRRSHASASDAPAPAATPLIAPTIGVSDSCIASTRGL